MTVHKSRFRRGDLVRYMGRDGSVAGAGFLNLLGGIFRVARIGEPQGRWTGPRTNWPATQVLTREDLDAGYAQPDGGWSWDPPEFMLHTYRESDTGERLGLWCVESEFVAVYETDEARQAWRERDARASANANTLSRLDALFVWSTRERAKGKTLTSALRDARRALTADDEWVRAQP